MTQCQIGTFEGSNSSPLFYERTSYENTDDLDATIARVMNVTGTYTPMNNWMTNYRINYSYDFQEVYNEDQLDQLANDNMALNDVRILTDNF